MKQNKMLKIIILVMCLLILKVESRTLKHLKVKLTHGGTLIGRYMISFKGNGIRAFLGIPYAKPPVNELRFKNPQPYPSWDGEKDATKDAPMCVQINLYGRNFNAKGNEDCLYLNVYTPINSTKCSKLPVIVYLHGGGWLNGNAASSTLIPDYIMDHKVIFVTPQYRLGPLGFLSTGDENCVGNFGFKDQTFALQWIQDNIESFGGDPMKVTLIGQSATAASVTYHMVSPLSEGLFQRAISQSGTFLSDPFAPAPIELAKSRTIKLTKIFGCYKENQKYMIECLQHISANDITEAVVQFFEWDIDPKIVFSPVIEPNIPGAFLPFHPSEIKEPHGLKIPWITGVNSDEGLIKTASIFNNKSLWIDLNQNWQQALEVSLYYNYNKTSEERKDITQKINDFYFDGIAKLEPQYNQSITDLFTDSWYFHGADEFLRIRLSDKLKDKRNDTYVYYFTYNGPASATENIGGGKENYYGVCHGDELIYLFKIGTSLYPTTVPSDDDLSIQQLWVNIWINFAQTGNPTPNQDEIADADRIEWKPTTDYPVDYMKIGERNIESGQFIKMESGLLQQRANFWMDLGINFGRERK